MKCVCLFVFVCLYLVESEPYEFHFPKSPDLKSRGMFFEDKPPVLKIWWRRVMDWDKYDPIIGYKIVIWEKKGVVETNVFTEAIPSDDPTPAPSIEDSKTNKTDDVPANPLEEPFILDVPATSCCKVTFDKIIPGVWYELSALAYTKKDQGPLSHHGFVKIIN
ncbi:uncharacterized protein LOC142973843 [Anticarsia gemmatalis]|uniref:uncharacterized protein LOC142973843 n=1 Tax=Anticarsia gemmatalis TaxID=129554 RepID=UPI003F76A0A8